MVCCANGVCCATPCDECVNQGVLTPGVVVVTPTPPVCPDATVQFTLVGTNDSGGWKRVNCVEVPIPPGIISVAWVLTVPADYPPPLPPLTGLGSSVSVAAKAPGTYSVTFTVTVTRDCNPGPKAPKGRPPWRR